MTHFCPHLWDTITIDHRGDVFSCCLIQPVRMGSIYSDYLADLINSPEITRLRQESLAGTLPCYAGCNLIDKTKTNLMRHDDLQSIANYQKLHTLYVDFGMKCNISCIMCKQKDRYKTDQTLLNAEMLIRHIDIQPFVNIFLQGGEPLFIHECRKFMDHLAEKKKKYSLLTNGLLIDKEMAARLAQEANIISISLNAATRKTHEMVNRGSSWERVLGNIQYLREYREKYNTNLSINGRMTITVPALPEIPQFLKRYEDFGFDTINFGYDRDTVPEYLHQNPEPAANLSEEIASVMSSVDRSRIDSLRLTQLGLL